MDAILGTSPMVFLFLTLLVFGGCAILTGQSLAEGWKGMGSVAAYGALLAAGDRFLIFGLAGGELLSLYGFVLHWVVLTGITFLAFRIARARRMVSQYPWLYDRAGPFAWKEKPGGHLAE